MVSSFWFLVFGFWFLVAMVKIFDWIFLSWKGLGGMSLIDNKLLWLGGGNVRIFQC